MANKGKSIVQHKYTNAQILKAIQMARGKPTAAFKALGCSSATFYERVHASPMLQEALVERRELELDRAEIKLFEAIDQGEPWAVCFFLKTIGRSRGFVERQDWTQPIQQQQIAPPAAQPINDDVVYAGIEYLANWLMSRGLIPTSRPMVTVNGEAHDNGYGK